MYLIILIRVITFMYLILSIIIYMGLLGKILSFGASFIPFKKGGKVSSASKRADGIAQRGKTKGRFR